jgi:hypothetical protein
MEMSDCDERLKINSKHLRQKRYDICYNTIPRANGSHTLFYSCDKGDFF